MTCIAARPRSASTTCRTTSKSTAPNAARGTPTVELPRPIEEVLAALAAGPLPWCKTAQVAFAMGWHFAETGEVLARLSAEGIVTDWRVPWHRDDAEHWWILTPLGAELLGVGLVERGPSELPSWQERSRPVPATIQPRDPALDGRGYGHDWTSRYGLTPPLVERPKRRRGKRRRRA